MKLKSMLLKLTTILDLIAFPSIPFQASPIPPSCNLSKPIEIPTWFGGIRYENPWDTWRSFWQKIGPLFRWKLCNLPRWSPPEDEADKFLPVLEKPDILNELATLPASNQVRATWLGHASVLMQVIINFRWEAHPW